MVLTKKRVGLHYGQFFHKLIRSALPRSFVAKQLEVDDLAEPGEQGPQRRLGQARARNVGHILKENWHV
jgi:hypothetical protein